MAQNLELALRIVAKDLASNTMKEVRAALGAVGKEAAAADARGSFAKTKAGIQSISDQLQVAKRAFLAFQAIQAAVASAHDITDRADAYASFTASLKLASGSAQGFAQAMTDVQRIAAATQAPIATVAQLYARLSQSLRAMGADQAQVADISETVALALRVSGASAAESGAAMLQLSQAFASGTLRGDEFNSVNEAAPRLMKALADSLDVPVGALRQMAEEGKLTADVLAENLPKALEKLREEAGQIPATIGGAFQQLSDAMTQYIGQTGEATGLSSGLAEAIKTLAEHFDLVGDAIIALGLGAALAGLLGLAGGLYGVATAAGVATVSMARLRLAMAALSTTPVGAFLTLAATLGTIVFSAFQVSDAIEQASDTAVDKTQEMESARQDLEARLDALIKRRMALEKQAAEHAKAQIKTELEARKKAIQEQISDAERLRDKLIGAWEEAGERSKGYLATAAKLRDEANARPKDSSIEGQAMALLDLLAAEDKLRNLRGQDNNLEDVQRQSELVQKLAGNLDDQARAQEAVKNAKLAEAAANEKAAAEEEKLQQGLAEQQKANAERAASFKAELEEVEAKLTQLTNEKTTLALKTDQDALAKVNADIDGIQAKLALLARGVTIPINSHDNTGGASGKFAAGGAVYGPGGPTDDRILARLSNNEHVLTAAEVAAAGGHAAIYRLRALLRAGMLPRFATGGAVLAATASIHRLAQGGANAAPSFPHLGRIDLGMAGGTYPVYAEPGVAGAIRQAALRAGGRR